MSDNFSILSKLTENRAWARTVQSFLEDSKPKPWGHEDFDTYWIVAGHHIREQVANDHLLASFLRRVLPPYRGGTIVLYRGENKQRFAAGVIGLSWSTNVNIATMFAQGLNGVGNGGILLRAQFEPLAVITEPNAHSLYLGEHQYTVDPAFYQDITVLAEFPSEST